VHRKIVTVVFCDMVGSTALGESTDPEALRALFARTERRSRCGTHVPSSASRGGSA
jgi:class 3 adenylate cyclase